MYEVALEKKMTRSSSIGRASEALAAGVRAKDPELLQKVQGRLATLLLSAISERASDDIKAIQASVSEAFARLMLSSERALSNTMEGAAWSMSTLKMVADVAADLVPQVSVNGDQLAAVDRILDTLQRSNSGKMTNKELARDCDLAEETVARILPKLVAQGKLRSWRAGRSRINEITSSGRDYLLKNAAAEARVLPANRWHLMHKGYLQKLLSMDQLIDDRQKGLNLIETSRTIGMADLAFLDLDDHSHRSAPGKAMPNEWINKNPLIREDYSEPVSSFFISRVVSGAENVH